MTEYPLLPGEMHDLDGDVTIMRRHEGPNDDAAYLVKDRERDETVSLDADEIRTLAELAEFEVSMREL